MKKRKSPGQDDVFNEHVIFGGAIVIEALITLFKAILKFEKVPDAWKTSVIIPIYKGNGKVKNDPGSYRPISLIPCVSKIFEKVILSRMNNVIEYENIMFPCTQQ